MKSAADPLAAHHDIEVDEVAPVRGRDATGGRSHRRLRADARQWTLNGDFLALAPNGVARYAHEVVSALDRLVTERHPLTIGLDIEIVAPKAQTKNLELAAIPIRVVPEFDRPRLPQAWVQFQLPRHVRGGLVSFCNLAPVTVRRQIVCIHDLHTRLMPESYPAGFRFAHRIILPILGRRAARITTVSEYARDQLAAFGVASPDKVTVTYNGSDHALRWDAAAGTFTPPTPRPFVLSLGRSQPYKNLAMLVRLADRLDAHGIDMVLAGETNAEAVLAHAARVPRNLHLVGRISDNDFARALSKALCFAFPSRIEGFGLPAVEAMTLGCPVVAAAAPCLPEICGTGAVYADPDDLEGWVTAVVGLEKDPASRARLAEAGRKRARRYSWQRIAEQYLELMREIDQS